MTPKYRARMVTPRYRYALGYGTILETEDGRRFKRSFRPSAEYDIGERVWVAKRLNALANDWCFEIYQVTVCPSSWNSKVPNISLGKDRTVLEKL